MKNQLHFTLLMTLSFTILSGCASKRNLVADSHRELQKTESVFTEETSEPKSEVLQEKLQLAAMENVLLDVQHKAKENKAKENADLTAIPLPIPESAESPSAIDSFIPSVHQMTLQEFEQLALANNPTIKQLAASASRVNGFRNQVGVAPNPIVGYFGSQIADQGTDQHGFFIEQEFVRGNKLALNERVLAHATQAQMWEVESQRMRVLTDIRLRYFEAVAAQKMQHLADEFFRVTSKGAKIAQLRFEAMEGTRIDVLQSQIQLNEIEIRRQKAKFSYQAAWKDLTAIAGMPYLVPTSLVDSLHSEVVTRNWDATYQSLLCSSPELSAARVRVCEAKANLARQKAQPTSNVTVQLGAGVDNATNSGLLNLEVSAPLSIRNKNSGNISAAYAKYCRATHEVKRIKLSLKSQLSTVAKNYDSAKIAVQKYENEIIPKAEQTLKLSEEAYQAGELNFLQVLIVQRTYFESKIQQVIAQRDIAQAGARIEGLLLTGGLEKPSESNNDSSLRDQTFSGQ